MCFYGASPVPSNLILIVSRGFSEYHSSEKPLFSAFLSCWICIKSYVYISDRQWGIMRSLSRVQESLIALAFSSKSCYTIVNGLWYSISANSKCKFCTLESYLLVIRPISKNAEKPLTFFREHTNRIIVPSDIISRISRHVECVVLLSREES